MRPFTIEATHWPINSRKACGFIAFHRLCGSNLYKAMTPAADGLLLIAATARGLGVRPVTDISVSDDGLVYPGGMSVSPIVAGLPSHRRPQELGGTGKDPVYCTCVADLPDLLV